MFSNKWSIICKRNQCSVLRYLGNRPTSVSSFYLL